MIKTLGGDRLGTGKKMQVELHNYERSTHDLGYLWRSTMSAGTLVPFMNEIGLPGDTFDIDLDCDLKTHPTRGPLFGSYKVQLDVFLTPIRLYNSLLHNNALNIGLNMDQVRLPELYLYAQGMEYPLDTPDLDNAQINPSCLLSYLGIRGVGIYTVVGDNFSTRSFNGIPLLNYWDIYKNYYAAKQEEIGAVIHTQIPGSAVVTTVDNIYINEDTNREIPLWPTSIFQYLEGTDILTVGYTGAVPKPAEIILYVQGYGTLSMAELCPNVDDNGTFLYGYPDYARFGDPIVISSWRYINASDLPAPTINVQTFPLSEIDEMREQILAFSSKSLPFNINNADLKPYKYVTEFLLGRGAYQNSQEGLGLKTYQSDLFNNWLKTEWIDGTGGISEVTAVDTSGGSFTIDTLNLAKKVYNMLNRIAVSGGTYDDWIDAVYVHDKYRRAETPMYMGGLIKELVFQEVVSNTQTSTDPLGTLAGKGVLTNKHKGGKITIHVDEPSYIMGIISLTPRLDYSQGNKWDVHLRTLNDLHKPALDEIGFQDLITEQMAWWSTNYDSVTADDWVQTSAGKQPAWLNYMTNVNQTRGNFAIANNEMFMTLNRRYTPTYDTPGDPVRIQDLTTYIDPSLYNFIFAQTALDSQNFWAQIAVDITARRKMSAKLMPNL